MNFLATNNLGGYLWYTQKPLSRYQGWFALLNGTMTKLIDSLEGEGVVVDLPTFHNALVVEHNSPALTLNFDIRQSYQTPTWNRKYSISQSQGIIWLRYNLEPVIIGIKQQGRHEVLDTWLPRHYPFDVLRNSLPFDLWIYQGLRLAGKRIIIGAGISEQEVINEINALDNYQLRTHHLANNAYTLAVSSLLSLRVYNKQHELLGLYGGLPWFFQFWNRDIAIAARALSLVQPGQAGSLLQKQCVRTVCPTYEDMAGTPSSLPSADGRLIAQLRLQQLGMDSFEQEYTDAEFIVNGDKETWMDTISRAGARIELQALKLALMGKTGYRQFFRAKVKEHFFQQGMLVDGINPDGTPDLTVRPNIFLAVYFYPDLLSRQEWERAIDYHLHHLWLPWGGLATLNVHDANFHPYHTGEALPGLSNSYHQGDSWFWINNVAAIVMHRLNPKKYETYVNTILHASTHDILKKGIPGHSSELSSACAFLPSGSPVQLWSVATYIELHHALTHRPQRTRGPVQIPIHSV